MLTAARLRLCRGIDDILGLFRELGYPIEPLAVDPEPWRRAGISIGWNGESDFRLAARLRHCDLFLLSHAGEEAIRDFLRSYSDYNVLTKSAVLYYRQDCRIFSVYDLSARRELRRLDVDLAAPTPHAVDRLNLLAAGGDPVRVFDLALGREALTRRFFERFRDAVRDVGAAVASACPDETAEACGAQALLILSRLLFLSFIQEKGWLGGERRFLFDRLRHDSFYASVLAPLFFGCLNTPADARDDAARRLGPIPYLNGGLFEPSPFERRHPSLAIPDELMRAVITEVFEKFDFSSDERDAAGSHVDPEMLGRVFESLMAGDERAASGSFYTPREIVGVLIGRAIDAWLGDGGAEEKLARLETITVLDPACGSGAFLLAALSAIEERMRALAAETGIPLPRDLRQRIVERSLYGVDIKAEAVRLCELRLWLAIVSASEAPVEEVRPLPNLDRNILQGNSLFSPTDFLGDGRGDIYREWVWALRAQSDLVERYRHAARSDRPALARLMRENDRRLASEMLVHAIDRDEEELQRLAAPHRDLFGRAVAADAERAQQLQQRIAGNRRDLDRIEEGTLDFFSFDIHFAPVIAGGGFDLVAGNPPWVRNARIESRARRMLGERYSLFRPIGERAGFHQPDLAVAFFERALALTKEEGVVAMLLPSKVLNAGYAAAMRRAAERNTIAALDDWSSSGKRHFDADTFPLGVTVIKRRPPVGHRVQVRDGEARFEIVQRDLPAGCEWSLVEPEAAAILRRLRDQHPPLTESLSRKPLMGVKTGDNQAFFLSDARLRGDALVTSDGIPIPLTYVARCVRGRALRRWSGGSSEWILWPPPNGWKPVPRWLERLGDARGVDPSELRLSFVKPEHVGIKVAWKDVSRGMQAAVLPDTVEIAGRPYPLVANQTLYTLDAVSLDEAYVLAAVLNSTVADALILATAERAKDAHFRYFGRTVGRIPLPRLAPDVLQWESLVRLSRRAHLGAANLDHEIDGVVAWLYGIDGEELAILRSFVGRRLDAG
jgi:hypothetical protein